MQEMKISNHQGHVIADFDGRRWVLDTGAPTSFGGGEGCQIGERHFEFADEFMGLDAPHLSSLIGTDIDGLIGTDILNEFDWLIDLTRGTALVSADSLSLEGVALSITNFVMGVPVVLVSHEGNQLPLFFDTGAPISYLQNFEFSQYPSAGERTDFYPGFGEFVTATFNVPLNLAGSTFNLVCGSLPGLLGLTLTFAGTSGILGSEVFVDRRLGYFPRRHAVVLG